MPYDSGFQLMSLNSWSPAHNPSEATEFHPIKKVVDVVTLTETITQHWTPASSDEYCTLTWDSMSKADKDTLLGFYKAAYISYVYVDYYGTSYNVVIEEMPAPIRNSTTDAAAGFRISIILKRV